MSDQARRWRLALYVVAGLLLLELCWFIFVLGRVYELLHRCEP